MAVPKSAPTSSRRATPMMPSSLPLSLKTVPSAANSANVITRAMAAERTEDAAS